jgi:hypothetical protein
MLEIPENYKPITIMHPKVVTYSFQRREVKCIAVEIDEYEYNLCKVTSKNYWANRKKGTWGSGLVNTEEDPRRVERTGLLGEMAFAKLFNVLIDLKYREGGDDQDFKIGLNTYNVKCATKNYFEGLVRRTNDEQTIILTLKHDAYVFGFVEGDDRRANWAKVILVGIAKKDQVANAEIKDAYQGTHLNYVVPYSELKSIVTLLKVLRG